MHHLLVLQCSNDVLLNLILIFCLLQGAENHIFDGAGPIITYILGVEIKPILKKFPVVAEVGQNDTKIV